MPCFRKLSLGALALLLLPSHARTAIGKEISLSRTLVIRACKTEHDCGGSAETKSETIAIPLEAFRKGNSRGFHGESKWLTTNQEIPFQGEIYVNEMDPETTGYRFSLYAVLRSGHGTKRHGVTKAIKVKDPSTFEGFKVTDQPIYSQGKWLQAEFTVGPAPAPTAGRWGLRSDFLVDSCTQARKCLGPMEEFRGRSNQTNGSAATVIWKIGTKRIVSWGSATQEANNVIKNKMDFSHTLFATFRACPMERDIPGHSMPYCVEAIRDLHWKFHEY